VSSGCGQLVSHYCLHSPFVVNLAMRFVGVIPARYNSSRIPGKPLIEIAGRPMIQWVYDRASQASSLAEVLVATEDERAHCVSASVLCVYL